MTQPGDEIESFLEKVKSGEISSRSFSSLVSRLAEKEAKDILVSKQPGYASNLTEAFAALNQHTDFEPGELVTWKPRMKNRKKPEYGTPMIVIEVLREAISSSSDNSGSPYFREPLDIICGFTDDENDLLLFHFDKRRLTHFQES